MHKQSWTYSTEVKIHQIDLIHLFESKEVAICLNGMVLFRDKFLEQAPQKFSFFIDDNFCEIHIHKENGAYFYEFIPHEYSTSKLGRQQKKREKLKNWGIGMSMFTVIFGLLIPFCYYLFQRHQNAIDLSLGGVRTTAIITQVYKTTDTQKITAQATTPVIVEKARVHYKFLVNSRWQYGRIHLPITKAGQVFTKEGIPIHSGQEFELLFSNADFRVHQVDFEQPTPKQTQRFQKQALQTCLQHQPPTWTPAQHWRYCDCFTTYTQQYYATKGLLEIIHQTTPISENIHFNESTYQQFLLHQQQQILQEWCLEEL